MNRFIAITILILFFTQNAKSEYLMTSKMRGFDIGFFGFVVTPVDVDLEKIGDEYYPLYYEDRNIFIEDERVSEYFNNNGNFVCKIPVKPDGRNYIMRLIHKIWSFFKDKGYYTIKENGDYEKVNIDELVFNCIKFENNTIVEPE